MPSRKHGTRSKARRNRQKKTSDVEKGKEKYARPLPLRIKQHVSRRLKIETHDNPIILSQTLPHGVSPLALDADEARDDIGGDSQAMRRYV